jgi:hypothetical protein
MLPAFHNSCLPPLSPKPPEATPSKASHHVDQRILNQEQKGLSGDPQRLDDVFPGVPERRYFAFDKNHDEEKKQELAEVLEGQGKTEGRVH